MMTKKDFIALADALREANRCTVRDSFSDDQLDTLARFCMSCNLRFKRVTWLDYIAGECGPSGGAIRKPKGSTK